MKVYVERLPVNCDKCPFHSRILLFAENHIENAVYKTDCRLGFTCKCGLQSLADYTKQVRKEVLDQVYKVFTTEDVWSELKSWWLKSGTCEELKACLDAMVVETSVENIVKKFGHHKNFYQMLDQMQGESNGRLD